MNKIIILVSIILTIFLINLGVSSNAQYQKLINEESQLEKNNFDMQQSIKNKEILHRQIPIPISIEYDYILNQIRLLESYSGTNMNVQLEGSTDTQDISSHYEETQYRSIRGLRIRIVVDKFSKETDMGAVLDDIHLLEKNTDFMASEISKDNNDLIVKGEVYGL